MESATRNWMVNRQSERRRKHQIDEGSIKADSRILAFVPKCNETVSIHDIGTYIRADVLRPITGDAHCATVTGSVPRTTRHRHPIMNLPHEAISCCCQN